MRNIILIALAPLFITSILIIQLLGFNGVASDLVIGRLYLFKAGIAVFQFRRWWLLNRWVIFLQDFKSPDWAEKYNKWPKK